MHHTHWAGLKSDDVLQVHAVAEQGYAGDKDKVEHAPGVAVKQSGQEIQSAALLSAFRFVDCLGSECRRWFLDFVRYCRICQAAH